MYLQKKIINEICKSLKEIDFLKDENVEKYIEKTQKDDYGDFTCRISFFLGKKMKKSPLEIAKEIVQRLKKNKFIEKVEEKNGYVNFFLNYEVVSSMLFKEVAKKGKNFGKSDIGKGKRVMVEFSQPNPVHPMHIGHARTTLLGDALSNILEFNGYKVIRANYMNDVGLQVAKLVTAYELWGEAKKPDDKPDLWLWKYYVRFHDEAKQNKELEEKARGYLRRFELLKDKDVSKLWRRIVDWCIEGFKETYERIGVDFDVYFYESDFRDKGKELVMKALKKGVAFKSDQGTIVADLEKVGMPNFVLLRSDGTGLYQTSDLGLTVYKFEKYKLSKSIWVVSAQQNLYFKQLFKTLELLGYEWVKDCYHLSFEHVVLQEGKMSSREGRAIMLDEVVENLTKLALEEVEKRNPKLPKEKKIKIAEAIGIGALRYNILKIEPNNMITFDWKQMLSFEGNTGPYLQYAYTRCKSILKNVKTQVRNKKTKNLDFYEKKLVKKILEFNEIVEKSCKELKPHYICNYLYSLSTLFSEFYHNCRVLDEKDLEKRNFRISLVASVKTILENSFKLLGIETPELM
jgi:arginyl-tRNA synthetase